MRLNHRPLTLAISLGCLLRCPGAAAGELQPIEAAPATPPQQPAATWAGTLELYGFAPLHTGTTTTINGFTASGDYSLGQVLRALTGAFSVRGSIERGRVGLMTDLNYASVEGESARSLPSGREAIVGLLRLRDQRPLVQRLLQGKQERGLDGSRLQALRERLAAVGPQELPGRLAALSDQRIARSLNTTINSQQGLYDIALRYRVGDREKAVARPGAYTLVPYAGVRIVDEGLTISNALSQGSYQLRSRRDSFGQPYAQALGGLWGQVFVTPRLRLFARGDLGTSPGGSGSDLSANAQVGVGYAIGNSTQLDLSWRYLHLDRDNGEDPRSAYQINQNGVELGMKIFF